MSYFFSDLETADCLKKAKVLFEGDSEYHHIMVVDCNGYRTLCLGPNGQEIETSINLNNPNETVFEYPGLMFNGLVVYPEAKNILLIGLGGGFMPQIFAKYLPQYNLTVVELDPIVAQLAEIYFGFEAKGNVKLVVEDGRKYIENLENASYDQIWLDAFSGNYIPKQLITKEFIEICADKLTPQGVLVQNLHQSRPLIYQDQIKTTKSVFIDYLAFNGLSSGNSIIISQKNVVLNDKWTLKKLLKVAKKMKPNPGGYSFYKEIDKYAKVDEALGARILLDEIWKK